ncbi:MAG: cobalamin biosynthesis protein CobQ [Paracoccaceae bacterium]|nr:cobalamin biosynthesis protein CobQ [Paracoccaceae bacterium]
MNTPAHLIFGMAAFAKRDQPKVTAAALAGALIPDLSLYLMAGVSLFVLQIDPNVVFGKLYFSDAWQAVFRVDNSSVVWGVLLAIALWRRAVWGIALTGAALLHIGSDFPLHHDDGRAHFWPLTSWIFESPVSYWDLGHHARIVAPIEITLSLLFCLVLFRRLRSVWERALVVSLGLAEVAPGFIWLFVFAR